MLDSAKDALLTLFEAASVMFLICFVIGIFSARMIQLVVVMKLLSLAWLLLVRTTGRRDEGTILARLIFLAGTAQLGAWVIQFAFTEPMAFSLIVVFLYGTVVDPVDRFMFYTVCSSGFLAVLMPLICAITADWVLRRSTEDNTLDIIDDVIAPVSGNAGTEEIDSDSDASTYSTVEYGSDSVASRYSIATYERDLLGFERSLVEFGSETEEVDSDSEASTHSAVECEGAKGGVDSDSGVVDTGKDGADPGKDGADVSNDGADPGKDGAGVEEEEEERIRVKSSSKQGRELGVTDDTVVLM